MEEVSFGISLPECDLVAGFDAVERHGVRFNRFQQSDVTLEGRESEE